VAARIEQHDAMAIREEARLRPEVARAPGEAVMQDDRRLARAIFLDMKLEGTHSPTDEP
jgi:hypothetical protein